MHRRLFLAGAAGAIATLATSSISEALAIWVPLGRRRVNLFVDHDTIGVGSPLRFRKIKLQVTGNGLYLYDLKVTYQNGGVDHIPVRWHIPQGGGTRVIDLRGGGRTYVNLYGRT